MSNDKDRMIMVTGESLIVLQASDDLGVPVLVKMAGAYWARADEFRAWESYQRTSSVEQP